MTDDRTPRERLVSHLRWAAVVAALLGLMWLAGVAGQHDWHDRRPCGIEATQRGRSVDNG